MERFLIKKFTDFKFLILIPNLVTISEQTKGRLFDLGNNSETYFTSKFTSKPYFTS
jgi:hypothetical protein